MRSVEPSSSVTVPPPLQTPCMPAKAPPDCAWPALLQVEAASTVANANTARRVKLLRDFLSIPLPPSGAASWPFAYAPLIDINTSPARPVVAARSAPKLLKVTGRRQGENQAPPCCDN